MRSNFPNLVDPFLKLTQEEVCVRAYTAAHHPLGVLLCWVGQAYGVPQHTMQDPGRQLMQLVSSMTEAGMPEAAKIEVVALATR